MLKALREHWCEYLIEAFGLGAFMVSAGVFVTLIETPGFPVLQAIPDPFLRRMLIGIAMGLTAIVLIYSPWGKRSGAHLNPAVSLTFFRLGKLAGWDALFYGLAQFIGGALGVMLTALVLGRWFTEPPVQYVVTVPGQTGWTIAFGVEVLLSFTMMITVLLVSNHSRLAQYTGLFAGFLVATFITVAAPFSGMSINPARTFASALPAQVWTAFWIYYFAPPLGMLLAAELYLRYPRRPRVLCGKLCPNSEMPCLSPQCCCMHEE